jgi:hypothetical protein
MSFISDFKTIIEADASVNALVTGGIKFDHLPEDFDISQTWIVWNYRTSEQIDSLSQNNCYTVYSVPITITATDSVVMNNICERLTDYLNNISTSNFIDIRLISDSKITTLSRQTNAYQNALEFNAIYVG